MWTLLRIYGWRQRVETSDRHPSGSGLADRRPRLLWLLIPQHRNELSDHRPVGASHRPGCRGGVAHVVRTRLQLNKGRQSISGGTPVCPQAGGSAIAVCKWVDPDPFSMSMGTEC